MSHGRIAIVGGGAAGLFAAITCAELAPGVELTVLEKTSQFLSKVRISGGGRCNVTHACFDARELSRFYPRGSGALIGAFHRFQPRDCIRWFESRGVNLKTESDGRVFPVTDSSQTIIDCLLRSARAAGVRLISSCGVVNAGANRGGEFELELSNGTQMTIGRLMLAMGGCRVPEAGRLAVALGHTLEPPVPSLFTFHVAEHWVSELAGISLPSVEASIPGLGLKERGAILLTHAGLSGPVILRLSAWGARKLHAENYRFSVKVNWLPELDNDQLASLLDHCRTSYSTRQMINAGPAGLPARLWQQLVLTSGVAPHTRWAELSKSSRHRLILQLSATHLAVVGKTLNREEFVTCGGVKLNEVDFKTMESRICPNLFFGGELLDVDGLTGGFNFQAAWTTGWIAGCAMAADTTT